MELLPLMNSPDRDDGGPEISGFSLRSLPELLRLKGGEANKPIRHPGGQTTRGEDLNVTLESFTFPEFSWSQSLDSVEEWWRVEAKA